MKEKVKESKKAPPDQGTPTDSEVQSQVSKDRSALNRGFILIKQKDCIAKRKSEGTRTRLHSADDTYRKAKFKSVGTAARVQCKRVASRIRRAIQADRSANDIATQVTMTRERESHENTRREVACEGDTEFQSEKHEDRWTPWRCRTNQKTTP